MFSQSYKDCIEGSQSKQLASFENDVNNTAVHEELYRDLISENFAVRTLGLIRFYVTSFAERDIMIYPL